MTSFNEANWGAFVWPNAGSWPRGGGRRGRGITFCIDCAASGSRPTSGSTAGSKKLAFWGKMNINEAVLMRRIGARSPGRTRGRGREPAGAEDGEFVFVSTAPHLVRVRRRVRPRDRKELGFWGKMNIHEARKLGTLSLAEREVEAASWRVQRTENSFLYNVRRVWFASGVGFDPRDRKNWLFGAK